MIRRCTFVWPIYAAYALLFSLAVSQLAAATSSGDAQALQRLAEVPWSVYSYSGKGRGYFAPACFALDYFSGTPLRFDWGEDLSEWKPGAFNWNTHISLIGKVGQQRIYQIVQHIHPKSKARAERTWPGETEVMKRLVVGRRPGKFCAIFQEQGPTGPSGIFYEIDPAELIKIDGSPVVKTSDPLTGNGGFSMDASWVFVHGVPIPLALPNNLIAPSVQQLLPSGCTIPQGESGGSAKLEYRVPTSCGGHLSLTLALRDQELVVVNSRYIPKMTRAAGPGSRSTQPTHLKDETPQ